MDLWSNLVASSWGKEFVAGGVGGSVGVLAGYPLDTVRIRQQHAKQASALGIVRRVVAKEGPGSLFRGMLAPLSSISFQNAITFQAYATLSRSVERKRKGKGTANDPPSYTAVGLGGSGAGVVQSVVICPIELVKIRLQLRIRESGVEGPLEVAKSIVRREGYAGIFRGLGITVLRDAPSHGVYFLAYEWAKDLLQPGCRKKGQETTLTTMVVAGGLAGSISWIACYPLDVIKTRIQAQSGGSYSGTLDCFRKSVSRQGYLVLWRGLGATIARAFVVNGAVFTAYEMALRCMHV